MHASQCGGRHESARVVYASVARRRPTVAMVAVAIRVAAALLVLGTEVPGAMVVPGAIVLGAKVTGAAVIGAIVGAEVTGAAVIGAIVGAEVTGAIVGPVHATGGEHRDETSLMHAGHAVPPVHPVLGSMSQRPVVTEVTIEQIPAPDPVIALSCKYLFARATQIIEINRAPAAVAEKRKQQLRRRA